MGSFIETTTSYPVAVFTVLLLTSVGYWVISTVLGVGDLGVDSDVEVGDLELGDGDVDVEASSDGGSSSLTSGLLHAAGIGVAPLSVVLAVFSLTAWTVSMLAASLIGSGKIVGTVIVLIAVVAGFAVSGRLAKLLRPLFVPQSATKHEQLIGRIVTVKTGRVTDTFGQGEIDGPGDEDHFGQIRCYEKNSLAAGDRALVVAVDENGAFTVSPDIGNL